METFTLAPADAGSVTESLADWHRENKVQRFWDGDSTLWTSADEGRWLGWLRIVDAQRAHLDVLTNIAADVRADGFTHAVLLGMGGSSLCPDVLRQTFGTTPGFPELFIVDSTDPAQIRAVEQQIDPVRTLFIVSSKSGSTLEPNIFLEYFYDRLSALVGEAAAGHQFIAITDPGSSLQRVAEGRRFRRIFFGEPSIGGRYSALSAFGTIPAAIIGVEMPRFLDAARQMVLACSPAVPPSDNPGVALGTVLGVLASRGRNKVTLITSPGIGDFGAWLEQLLAESTGKMGRGLIPIDGEPIGPPAVYGDDRLFIYVRLTSAPAASQDSAIAALEHAGHPVVRIAVADPYSLGAEFFRWEIATAVAGSILAINPFDQPDVEASKVATRRLTDDYERTGMLPAETALVELDGIRLFADVTNAAALKPTTGERWTLGDYMKAHLNRLIDGDYFALLAYVEMNGAHANALRKIRRIVRDARRVATCAGFGPRFLHSTGQAYKGGPNSGVFLQITCDDAHDLAVPGRKYTFGVVKAAQARGDFEVLSARGRRALRVHLGTDVDAGLKQLEHAIRHALS